MADREYVLTTDNTTDFPESFLEECGIEFISLSYVIDGVIYDGVKRKLGNKEFYDRIRGGAMPVTQQANPESSKAFFERFLKEGKDILHIAFSSGLSGTYQSAHLAQMELAEEYPDRKIIVIDSLCASMGEGLLVYEAWRRKNEGMDLETLAKWVEDHKLLLFHDVVADDLFHLQRGGRVSKTAAIMGTALGIKPMIYVNDEGKLIPYGKVRGKKAAFNAMVERLAKTIDTSVSNEVFISHSDCLEEAQALEEMIRQTAGIHNFKISYIGSVIGTHTGVGTVALFYFASGRTPK